MLSSEFDSFDNILEGESIGENRAEEFAENEEEKKKKWYLDRMDKVYKNLRKCYDRLISEILGEGYYCMSPDTIDADQEICEAILSKVRMKGGKKKGLFEK